MSTGESWGVNRHTARCTSVVSQCKLVPGCGTAIPLLVDAVEVKTVFMHNKRHAVVWSGIRDARLKTA